MTDWLRPVFGRRAQVQSISERPSNFSVDESVDSDGVPGVGEGSRVDWTWCEVVRALSSRRLGCVGFRPSRCLDFAVYSAEGSIN